MKIHQLSYLGKIKPKNIDHSIPVSKCVLCDRVMGLDNKDIKALCKELALCPNGVKVPFNFIKWFFSNGYRTYDCTADEKYEKPVLLESDKLPNVIEILCTSDAAPVEKTLKVSNKVANRTLGEILTDPPEFKPKDQETKEEKLHNLAVALWYEKCDRAKTGNHGHPGTPGCAGNAVNDENSVPEIAHINATISTLEEVKETLLKSLKGSVK